MFIALEGIDGSGTTTQAKCLAAALRARGLDVLETREPTNRAIGRLIRASLREQVEGVRDRQALALLFAADRLEHVQAEIEPALTSGAWVVCDRYVLSSLVYQSLDCPLSWVAALNERARRADLTFLLDLPAADASARVDLRLQTQNGPREIFEHLTIQTALAAQYRELVQPHSPYRSWLGEVEIVAADASVQAVTDALIDGLRRRNLIA